MQKVSSQMRSSITNVTRHRGDKVCTSAPALTTSYFTGISMWHHATAKKKKKKAKRSKMNFLHVSRMSSTTTSAYLSLWWSRLWNSTPPAPPWLCRGRSWTCWPSSCSCASTTACWTQIRWEPLTDWQTQGLVCGCCCCRCCDCAEVPVPLNQMLNWESWTKCTAYLICR